MARIEEKVDGLVRKLEEFIQDTRRERDSCNQRFIDHERRLRDIELVQNSARTGLTVLQKLIFVLATLCSIAAFVISLLK